MVAVNFWRLLDDCYQTLDASGWLLLILEAFGRLIFILGTLRMLTNNSWRSPNGCCEFLDALDGSFMMAFG